MKNWIPLSTITIALSFVASVSADDNVREVQTRLSDEGFYSGEVDGAYSTELSAALSRYQIRKGLPITGQLDVETSNALGASPAVGPSTAATKQSSDTWRKLRNGERRKSTSGQHSETAATEARETSSPADNETAPTGTEMPPTSAPVASEAARPAALPATALDTGPPAPGLNTERLRDYVAAFVLAGLDKNVGAETEFFADRVQYYDQGIMDRDKIREDLKRYDERWPERHFWVAGTINIEPQAEDRVQLTFPLGFKLRNGNKQISGKVDKTLLLEPAGGDFQIVAVNEASERRK